MTAKRYSKIYSQFTAHPAARRAVVFLDKWLPLAPFVCYPVLLFALGLRVYFMVLLGISAAALEFLLQLLRAVLVPAAVFLGGTLLRKALDRPRPYEQAGFVPLVQKNTRGKSFPSRHALSAAVLAVTWYYYYPAVGCAMAAVAIAICALRVLIGVHHPRDVIAGAALGFALGAVGMYIL